MKKWNFPWEKVGYLLLLLSGVFGVESAFLARYPLPYALRILVAAMVWTVLLGSMAFWPKKARLWGGLGFLAVWIGLGIRFWREILWGLLRCAEYLMPTVEMYLPLQFPELLPLTPEEGILAALAFLFLLAPYLALVSWSVMGRRSFWFSFLLTGPIFLFSWGFQTAVPLYAMIPSLFFWLSMLYQTGIPRRFRLSSRKAMGGILLAAGILSLLVLAAPPERYEPWGGAADIRAEIVSLANRMPGWFQDVPDLPGGGSLSGVDGEVNLDHIGELEQSDGDVLRVYSPASASFYLRGYSASVYTGHQWLSEPDDQYPAAGFGFQPLAFLTKQELTQGQPLDITVEPLIPSSRYAFTPYLITQTQPELSWEQDRGLLADGREQYTFQSLAYTDWGVINGDNAEDWFEYPTLGTEYRSANSFMVGDDYYYFQVLPGYGPVLDNTEFLSDQELEIGYQILYGNSPYSQLYSPIAPSWGSDGDYMVYLHQYYTQLPDEVRYWMMSWWKEHYTPSMEQYARSNYVNDSSLLEGQVPYWLWSYAAGQVARVIRDSGEYNTNPGYQPPEEDFVQYFLEESNQGYCVHFATAATVMLRALGIPARYVEGYVVDRGSFRADQWANVPARNAHAWAEIWVPGTGWIPVEATPGGAGLLTAGNTTQEVSVESEEESSLPESSLEESSVESSTEISEISRPETSEQAETPANPSENLWIWCMALGGFLILLLAASPFFTRWIQASKRKRKMNQPDCNRAALEIYGELLSLQKWGGLDVPENALETARKARFSRHQVTKEELDAMWKLYRESRQKVWAESSKWKRLRLWIRGY